VTHHSRSFLPFYCFYWELDVPRVTLVLKRAGSRKQQVAPNECKGHKDDDGDYQRLLKTLYIYVLRLDELLLSY
jgi:hypothetical protein